MRESLIWKLHAPATCRVQLFTNQTCAYIGFFLNDPSKFDEVVARLKTVPEVVECYFTTGKYDLFIKLYAQNNDHLLQVIHDRFMKMGLGRSETLITFREVFKRQIPIEPEGSEATTVE